MSDGETVEVIIRGIDKDIFTPDSGAPLTTNSAIAFSENAKATVTEKTITLGNELNFFMSIAVPFVSGIGIGVLTNLISDWIKDLIKKWLAKKPKPSPDKLVVIMIINNICVEFRIEGNEIRVTTKGN